MKSFFESTQNTEDDKYFVFMDESGNNTQDRFFVLGVLIVRASEIGDMFNFLEKISAKILTRSRNNMARRLDEDFENGNMQKVLKAAKSYRSFEMKFSAINKENENLYKHILHKYFGYANVRFCAIVFDKKRDDFHPDGMSHWNRYLNNAALLISKNMEHLPSAEFVILPDQITQPSEVEVDYENALRMKIIDRIKDTEMLSAENIFGVARLESHSSMLLQLTDILAGAVAYDFREADQKRKEDFVSLLREKLGRKERMNESFTVNSPNYFSVWKFAP